MDQQNPELTQPLLEIARDLVSNLELSELLPTILDHLARVVSYASSSIMLIDGEYLMPVAQRSVFNTHGAPMTVHIDELAHVREVIDTRRPLIIGDTQLDHRWKQRSSTSFIRCWLGVPLVVKDQVIGLLNLSHGDPNYYGPKDVELTVSFGAYAAVAIENARLYARAQHEITERIHAERALAYEREMLARRVAEQTADIRAANEELARSARYKDEFLAAMSHELRTPLNTIIGMSDVMMEGVYGVLNEKQRRAMVNLQDSGYHLLSLINDILDVAKLAAGQMRLHREVIDVDSLCSSCLAMVKKAADDKRIVLLYTREDRIEKMVADSRRMRQIIVNLLSNAVKYTNEEGSIGLDVRCGDEGETVILTVWDTGIGIAPEDMKRLFKPFVQVDSSLTRRYEGTGLGLTIVQSLAALHGGSVRLESEVGAGSRFVVAVPWIRQIGESTTRAWNPDSDTDFVDSIRADSPLLLLAEDNESSIEMVSGYFESAGYRVHVARNGLAAVQLAASLNPDVIVMDIQMPELDGHQAMQRIRREEGGRHVPIIAVTALAMPGDEERSREAGANEYLTKPVSLRHLRKHIEHLLTLDATKTRDEAL